MKSLLSRFLNLLKALFLRLTVAVTLHIGQDKVEKDEDSENADSQKGNCHEDKNFKDS